MSEAGGSGVGGPAFQNMTDAQLRQAITQLSNAAGRPQPSTTPAQVHPGTLPFVSTCSLVLRSHLAIAYMSNIRQWSNSVTPPPTNGRTNPSRKSRPTKGSSLAPTSQPSTSSYQPAPPPTIPRVATPNTMGVPPAPPVIHDPRVYPPRPPLPTVPQAYRTTYPSRLRTGATLLMQPILSQPTAAAVATRSSRRGGLVNYADPGSGDEFLDAGAIDSDDSDFIASGGTRTTIRTTGRLSSKAPVGAGVFSAGGVTHIVQAAPQTPMQQHRSELDQSYLGMIPPQQFITAKPVLQPTQHQYL